MKLKEAITVLSLQLRLQHLLGKFREADAVKLGIEALKRLRELRIDNPETAWQLLPGETEDPHA
ncbi:hypothetical protein ES703_74939 [subsurface metagenome]